MLEGAAVRATLVTVGIGEADANSEKAAVALGRVEAQVLVGARGRDAASGGALDEPPLEEVRLVHVLDRVPLLAHRDRERRQSDRTTVELLHDRPEDLPV